MLKKIGQYIQSFRKMIPVKTSCSDEEMNMYQALKRVQSKQHFAWVQLGSDEQQYQSAILDVNLDERTIVLDEPFGLPTDFHWWPGLPLSVTIKESPQRMHFNTHLIGHELDPVQNRILIDWPKEMEKKQRRDHYRLVFEHFADFEPGISFFNQSQWCSLKDLSVTGLSFELTDEWLEKLHPEMRIDQVNLFLSSQEVLRVSLLIKRVKWHEERNCINVGARFVNQSPHVQRQLSDFILFVQRQERQSVA